MRGNDPPVGDAGSLHAFDGGQCELDRVLRALADERCRHVCYHVFENDPTDISACAEAVAFLETDQPPSEVSEHVLQQTEILLYHRDLPKLSQLGIIEYDERSEAIRCQHSSCRFERLLTLVREMESE